MDAVAAAPTLLGLFPEARRLTPEERTTVLKSFSSQRAKAEAALGR